MTYRIAINGYGRIGRCVLRALYEHGFRESLELVAVNDIAGFPAMVHLTKYDSIYGRFSLPVSLDGETMAIGNDRVRLLNEPDMDRLPWKLLDIDLVLECTGLCTTRSDAARHLAAGAGRVLLSYPGPADVDRTVVRGVNHGQVSPNDRIVSNASCTSNCLIPVLKTIDDAFGIECGQVTTIHAAMHDQPVGDSYHHADPRRMRAAERSIVPVDTHLGSGVARVLPGFEGKIEAIAVRIPSVSVSAMDITLLAGKAVSAPDANRALMEAAGGHLAGILGVNTEPLVSCDFQRDTRSAVIEASLTRAAGGRLVKLYAWFDNEWAYAVRMCETAAAMRGI
ncbi:MAG: erythrose-4-phosphate dehydrogenase [Spirochaetes bacterium]|nr:MAG: erythrose-4-phosphate dehydrogenase [Spirochaetota bacterium]